MRELVFVHGRAQQHKDAVALKAEWISAWKEGLAKSGLDVPIPETTIRFPYYGDALYDLVAGKTGDEAADIVVRGGAANAEQDAFTADIVKEIAEAKGISDDQVTAELAQDVIEKGPLNWEWVQGILRVIDRRVPFGSGASIALFTNDVYQYLQNIGIRDRIEEGVRGAFKANGETVVVSHSLGTVVAYNVLRRDGEQNGWKVPLFVTLGSPLAVSRIKQGLKPIGYPKCAARWFNAMDDGDVVALYPLTASHFAKLNPAIENKTDVVNQTDNQHGISGYLNDKEVAKRIYDALTA